MQQLISRAQQNNIIIQIRKNTIPNEMQEDLERRMQLPGLEFGTNSKVSTTTLEECVFNEQVEHQFYASV